MHSTVILLHRLSCEKQMQLSYFQSLFAPNFINDFSKNCQYKPSIPKEFKYHSQKEISKSSSSIVYISMSGPKSEEWSRDLEFQL